MFRPLSPTILPALTPAGQNVTQSVATGSCVSAEGPASVFSQAAGGSLVAMTTGSGPIGPGVLRDMVGDSGTEPAPYQPDFLRLGIPVTGGVTQVSPAHENTRLYLRSRYIAEDKLRLPTAESRYGEILGRLAQAAGLPPDKLELYVVYESSPNAWWIRGTNTICVTTGLLKKPGLTEGELAHVLGHEIGHYLMHRPDGRGVPERFKNPLFRQFVLETHAARGQTEEYQADELGLLLADAAGWSVDEGLEMERWLAGAHKTDKAEKSSADSKTRVLRPGESHPHGDSRVAAVAGALDDPRFVWRNRGVTALALPFEVDRLSEPNEAVANFPDELDPLDHATIREIARNPKRCELLLDEENVVCLVFDFLRQKMIRLDSETETAIRCLQEAAGQGDLVARAYLTALLSKLYFDAVKKSAAEAGRILAWLGGTCGVSKEEVLLALVEYLESTGTVRERIELLRRKDFVGIRKFGSIPTKDFYYGLFPKLGPPSRRFKLVLVVSAFPHSPLRDRLIGALLRFPDHIKDRNRFLWGRRDHQIPLNEDDLKMDGSVNLAQLLHGTSIADFSDLHEFDNIDDEIFRLESALDFSLGKLLQYVGETAGPYDRGELEAALAESIGVTRHLVSGASQGEVGKFYSYFQKRAESFSEPFLRERVLGIARLVVLRHLEAVPAEGWEAETVSLVEAMPPSTERNHLLILLDRAGKRPVSLSELIFKEVPSPDESGSLGVGANLLNAFGFVGTGEAEVVYPSGQRVLDRFRADRLPNEGVLSLDQVCQAIPRPSPIRDELIDRCGRCEAGDVAGARALLDSYWSPMAAYAKAYEISLHWLQAPDALQSILQITDEFPSLRRRMVTAWADRYGIDRENYETMLRATQDSDAVDLYRGDAVEQSRQASRDLKATICLASFASALSRGQYSLLSLQDTEPKKIWKWSENEKIALEAPMIKANFQYQRFADYSSLLPENAGKIARIFSRGGHYELHRIPFVDGRPAPNQRFQRQGAVQEGVADLRKWDGGKAFSRFMQAMGWQEAAAFYEELLLGKEGVLQDSELFQSIERVFLEGISLLLEEKEVPLARVQNVRRGLEALLAHQPLEVRGQIWARILAGIAQEKNLGEIVREAARPLGAAAGGKLMQAVHSLTTGVDATLEEATRLALDQTASFTLFDALQFLGSRGVRPFDHHESYRLLGQGSVRAAIEGVGGAREESAYLLVHARSSSPGVVRGIANFIQEITRQGEYFPLSPAQFRALVEQTEEERTVGFANHLKFGELHDWRLGEVRIPRLRETHGDWARIELAQGESYTTLKPDARRVVAPVVVEAALSQFRRTTAEGRLLINPETHGGNILYDASQNQVWLVDCGLLGEARMEDAVGLAQIHSAFATYGLAGATAALFTQNEIDSLGGMKEKEREALLAGLKVLDGQIQAGTAPELLLPGLAVTMTSIGGEVSPGLDTLFRGLQHLAPYLRETSERPAGLPVDFDDLLPRVTPERFERLAKEIEQAGRGGAGGDSITVRRLPKGLAVGRIMRSGAVSSVGVLKEDLDPEAVQTEGPAKGMIILAVEAGRQFLRPADLRIQIEGGGKIRWVTLEEFEAIRPARRV